MGSRRRARIGITGSFGGLNLGDEAILMSMVRELRETSPVELDITVFSRNPAHTLAHHDVQFALPARELSRDAARDAIAGLDLFIVGGGGILFDREATIYLRDALLAQEVGVPVVTYAIGAGPLEDPTTRRVVRSALNRARFVSVRDEAARRILEDCGVRAVTVTADPALRLLSGDSRALAKPLESFDPDFPWIGISVREPGPAAPDINEAHYHALLADAADYMIERFNARLVFVPMEPHVDPQQSHAVIARMTHAQHTIVLPGEFGPDEVLALMSRFAFALGMRLHFLVFAATKGVPFVPLPYAGKVSGFIERVGVASPPMHRMTAGRLIAYIDRSWDLRRELRARLEQVMPELSELARTTAVRTVAEIEKALANGRSKPDVARGPFAL